MSKVFIHQTAIVDMGASIGVGTKIWHWVHVCAGASIGKDVSLGQNVFVGNRVAIGDDCKIQNNVSIHKKNLSSPDSFKIEASVKSNNKKNPL